MLGWRFTMPFTSGVATQALKLITGLRHLPKKLMQRRRFEPMYGLSNVGLRCMLVLAISVVGSVSALSDKKTPEPLVLEATIPLDDVVGRIDHMAIDLEHRRLIVAELGNDTVD